MSRCIIGKISSRLRRLPLLRRVLRRLPARRNLHLQVDRRQRRRRCHQHLHFPFRARLPACREARRLRRQLRLGCVQGTEKSHSGSQPRACSFLVAKRARPARRLESDQRARIANFEFGAKAQHSLRSRDRNRPRNGDINFFESTNRPGRISFQRSNPHNR